MMKRRIEPTAVAALAFCLVTLAACTSVPSADERRGPAGSRVDFDCGGEEEMLTDPERKRSWMTREDCREDYVARLEQALATAPRIDAFSIRSGEIAAAEIPPSDEWEVGASPKWSDAPAHVIPVRFDEPLRWEPYITTWFPELESTKPETGRSSLIIAKENPTPEGFEIHLVALGGSQVHAVSVAWVAYDTTTMY